MWHLPLPRKHEPARAMTRPLRLCLPILTLTAAFAAMPLASAQIFTGAWPASPVTLPNLPAHPAAPNLAHSNKEPDMAAPAPEGAAAPQFRYLPHTLEGFQINGETGLLQWPVYLTQAQAATPTRFRVSYLSAISVLDESSVLTLKINGRTTGATAVDAARSAKSVEFEIPAGVLVRGYNSIALALQQRHRVDCSVGATYELWTKIDPSQTGFIFNDAPAGPTDTNDLAALMPAADGSVPIRVVIAGKIDPAYAGRLVKAIQTIAIAGKIEQPSVDFGAFSDEAGGVNLVLGTRQTLSQLTQFGDLASGSGASVRFVSLAGSARPTLVVTGSTDEELDAAIAQLGDLKGTIGSPDGLRAAAVYPGLATAGDTRLTLRDFAVPSQEFSGRLLRQSFDLVLPPDFLPADYARGTFDLAGGYAAGLTRDARVRIDVNGRNAGQVNLPNRRGDVFRHNAMFFPLSLMRPGLNRIEVFAETPRPEDASCAAPAASGTDKRFLLLDSSELTLPRLARVQRLPDLALFGSGGLPYLAGHPQLFVPTPDRHTMAAALSLVARAAVAAGTVIPFEFTIQPPAQNGGSVLIVGPARALDPAVMSASGLDPAGIEAAWRDRAALEPQPAGAPAVTGQWWAKVQDSPLACRLPSPVITPAPHGAAQTGASSPVKTAASMPVKDDDLFERWTENVHGPDTWRSSIATWPERAGTWITATMNHVRSPWRPAAAKTAIAAGTSLIVAQSIARGAPGSVTTIVTAPDALTLQASVGCLADPEIWTRMRGRLTLLDASAGTVESTEADHLDYSVSSSFSPGNARLVLAGWLSLNPLSFVIIALLTAVSLSGTTFLFVRGIGRRNVKK